VYHISNYGSYFVTKKKKERYFIKLMEGGEICLMAYYLFKTSYKTLLSLSIPIW